MTIVVTENMKTIKERYEQNPHNEWLPRKFGIDYDMFFKNTSFSNRGQISEFYINELYIYFYNQKTLIEKVEFYRNTTTGDVVQHFKNIEKEKTFELQKNALLKPLEDNDLPPSEINKIKKFIDDHKNEELLPIQDIMSQVDETTKKKIQDMIDSYVNL
jgi:hypothetical protein